VPSPTVDGWAGISAAERETFFSSIARHRAASWRVTAACVVAVTVLAVVVAILMAPLLYCLLGIALDLVNIIVRTPDLLGWLGPQIDAIVNGTHVTAWMIIRAGLLAALPGLALMALATSALRHIWTTSPLFDGGDLPGRAPDTRVLEEQRLANVVEEMAIAAGVPPPRIVIVPGGANAAACGRNEARVTILAGEALPGGVARDQLQGMIGHLVGSIANGDMTIGLRVTTTLALFGLIARVGGAFTDRHSFRQAVKLWRLFVTPTSANTAALLGELADPFHEPEARAERPAPHSNTLTWREWLQMPLMGPVLLTGFLTGLVSEFMLEPLVAAAWRQRKYMADAAAVQLTRQPDGLASALAAIAASPRGIAPWTAHLAVAADRHAKNGPFGNSIVPIFPSPEKRIAALVKMGAHVQLKPKQVIPAWLVAIGAVLGVVVAGLLGVVVYLLVMVSAALSGLFTIMPAAALHVLLRWLAG
jgi:Zn-dependent protease with chaperone function